MSAPEHVVVDLIAEYRERVRLHDALTGACADLRRERGKAVRDQHEATAEALEWLSSELTAAQAEIARLTNAVKFREEMHECAMAERDDCIMDWSEAKSEIARLTAERDAAMAGRVKVKTLAEIPVFVLIADNHSYDAMQQWLAGVFLTKEEAEDARVIEEAKPGVMCCDVHEWTMIVDTSRILAAIQPDTERAEPVSGEKLQLSERYQAIYDQACARDALDEKQGLHLRMGFGGGVVEVCPVCDIAGCHHIRARATIQPDIERAEPVAVRAPDVEDLIAALKYMLRWFPVSDEDDFDEGPDPVDVAKRALAAFEV